MAGKLKIRRLPGVLATAFSTALVCAAVNSPVWAAVAETDKAGPAVLQTEAAGSAAAEMFGTQRRLFKYARTALGEGDYENFDFLLLGLQNYPLRDYLEFDRLQRSWREVVPGAAEVTALNHFEQRTGDVSLTRRLTRTLQKRFADTEQWRTFLGISKSRLAAELPCTTLKARSETGQLHGFDEAALALWVKPKKQPEPCATILKELTVAHTPPVSAIWERIYSAMEANKPEFAEPMLEYLASKDRALVKQWIAAGEKPQALLKSGNLAKNTVLTRRIIADLVVDWSRLDTPAAINYWLSVRDDYTFYEDRYYDTHRAITMRSAYRRLPGAHDWLNSFVARTDDLELLEWRVRTALLAEDWQGVIKSLADLPLQEQVEDHWAYWEARAYDALGDTDVAKGIYTELAGLQSYYGFLSADRLGVDYSIYNEAIEPSEKMMSGLKDEPALIKAREFHFVGLPNEGRREWNNWLSGRSRSESSAAAVLASEWTMFDRAIFSAGQAEHRRAISLRFPLLYRSEVAEAAEKNSIEPAWIFGVMRRESAYIRDIRSGAGAVGLMQLMPRTAQYVAKLQGQKAWRGDLTDSATNIGFGTFYLRHVMDRFDDHQVLATASYNAGPHRVDGWLEDRDMDADLWIDTIPFTETRRYVRAVLAYSAIYEFHLTGRAGRLSSKLRPVPSATDV